MHILWMLIIGLIVGALAKLIMPGKNPGGVGVTMLLGVAGSFVAGYVGRAIGHYQVGDTPGIITSTLGAIFILWVYRLFLRLTHHTTTTGGPAQSTV
jgi:uncharacterized membrane protein YeaQ/YmgE (transglycosylase-associated protein family)